jgi:hypothetical protein
VGQELRPALQLACHDIRKLRKKIIGKGNPHFLRSPRELKRATTLMMRRWNISKVCVVCTWSRP